MARSEFLQRFEEFVGASGWRTVMSPSELVEQWREFVEICAEGFSSTIYDYTNERSVRDLLQKAFDDPVLRDYSELGQIREAVETIDRRFARECRAGVAMAGVEAPWWHRCVPREAVGDFADDLRAQFGIEDGG
ncbi:MAG: hypothetical protein GY745_24080 [Actinomycetia bacterium]|nr:hypothetical protein [Actinomycetes bacterium]